MAGRITYIVASGAARTPADRYRGCDDGDGNRDDGIKEFSKGVAAFGEPPL
jgi:hypothetical protein